MLDERDVLVVPVDDENERLALCASEPGIFFTEPHYDGYAMVLVRRAAIDASRLSELLADAREIVIEKLAMKRKRRKALGSRNLKEPPTVAGEELASSRSVGDEHGLAQDRLERERGASRTRRYTTM